MAQTYEIDIKRFNGQDYDTLLPTPADHAATHQANGSDPITMQTGNYGNGTVTAAKIAANAVSTSFTVTLAVASWSNKNQTVTASGVTTSNTIIVTPAPASFLAYGEAQVRCISQATNSLTFQCEDVPTVALTVNVTCINK